AIGWDANNTSGLRFGIGYTGGGLYMFRTPSPLGTSVGKGNPALYDFMINDAGFVGIGTIAPQTQLQIQGPSTTETSIKSTGAGSILSLDSTQLGQNQVWTLENGLFGTPGLFGIYDRTAAQARLTISPGSGNVGIGTTTPDAKLHVEAPGANSVVHGKATGANTGVFGESTSTAAGTAAVYGKNLAGFAFAAEGNVTQNRDKGGWVKAMLFVEATGEITRAYNGLTGQSFQGPPSANACGFKVTKEIRAHYTTYVVDLGFRVDDRFASVTPGYSSSVPTTCSVSYSVNEISVVPFLQAKDGGDSADANFTIIVY
ncbi:MAG: hypothetical protein NTY38_28365, partial [Acidobacteria bacterium]|nr:hypothetical protein [Acidobacteriota bacterium]